MQNTPLNINYNKQLTQLNAILAERIESLSHTVISLTEAVSKMVNLWCAGYNPPEPE